MIDQNLHTPDYITNLPAVMTMGRIPVENPKKGQRKTQDAEVVHYYHYTAGLWSACYFMNPHKELGVVLLTYDQQVMMEAKGHVAMGNAMEMIDHWQRTRYVPKVPENKCLADYSPSTRFGVANAAAAGKATKPFTN